MTKVALTIAGSDSGGGAGIQADLKTFQELGVFGTSVVTAVTAQNTLGVQAVYPVDRIAVRTQAESIGVDFPISALKTGMLCNAEIIEETAQNIIRFGWKNIVVDPVMIAKGGASLLQMEAVTALKEILLPVAQIVTPNIPEAELLAGMKVENDHDCIYASERILHLGVKAIVLKGGHRQTEHTAEDLYMDTEGRQFSMQSERINTKDTHGTGCTFSAALTAGLAIGNPMSEAVLDAKKYIQAAIKNGLGIGKGHGPTNHWGHRYSYESEVKVIDANYTH